MSSAKSSAPHTKKKAPGKRRSLSPSTPDVKLSYQAAGRDTLAAIDEELAQVSPSPAEAPVIEISETPIGRETLAAITEELTAPPRARQNTLPYADKIKNAPGARSPSHAPAPPQPKDGRASASAATPAPAALEARGREGAADKSPSSEVSGPAVAPPPASLTPEAPDEVTMRLQRPPLAPRPATSAVEIFELLTFIVRGSDVGDLSTDVARRKFVQEHLLRRVPSGSMDVVERIEVTPWTTKGTMVMRIWCRA